MREIVTLNRKEQTRVKVITMVMEGRCSAAEAAQLLQMSRRHVLRLKKAFREEGPQALAHGNRGRRPGHAVRESERQEVLDLASPLYAGYNHTHLHEMLVSEQGVRLGRRSVSRILTTAGFRSPKRRRGRRHRSWRERMPREGMMLQVDGSYHDWLEARGPKLVLVGAVDDATGELVHALFRDHEDAQGYLTLLREVIRKKGVPLAWYSDRHGIFVRNDKEPWTLSEELAGRREPTQVARALEELGVNLILARSPQAKGRVERCWGTLQDRLVKELRRANACTLTEANQTLKRYLPRFKERFACPPADPKPAYQRLPRGADIDAVCSFHYLRTVANDNTVRLEERFVQVPPGPGGRSYAGCRVQLQERLDGSLTVHYQGRQIAHQPAASQVPLRARRRNRRRELAQEQQPQQPRLPTAPPSPVLPQKDTHTTTPAAKPALDHPWRRSFRRQVTKSQAS